jgi:hypothetical protein
VGLVDADYVLRVWVGYEPGTDWFYRVSWDRPREGFCEYFGYRAAIGAYIRAVNRGCSGILLERVLDIGGDCERTIILTVY